jgi:hypothetical protein
MHDEPQSMTYDVDDDVWRERDNQMQAQKHQPSPVAVLLLVTPHGPERLYEYWVLACSKCCL